MQQMSDALSSSLCQLNWLIAKSGAGAPHASPTVSNPPSEVIQKKHRPRKFWGRDEKPPFSYSQLIRMAIENQPDKKIALSEIYEYIMEQFPFYKECRNSSWKNSIRHNLSLNKQFQRLEKIQGKKGSYWTCVAPPEKKPKILEGSPPRINPAIEKLLNIKPKKDTGPATPVSDLECAVVVEDRYLTNDEIAELNLFDSCNLNQSFKVVYDQIYQKDLNKDHQNSDIDWHRISVETAQTGTLISEAVEEEDEFDWNLIL
ncbi:unnamed protein product [Caenorhabditis bovis]|uniref:Forkhead box protein pes-1 n=1 Tax=Caenorhabditis bovis TaxID=2654633 RepID=A0A8S1EJF0_9PELO|nr:unnamed protein product [Caenorhabditis bovis]